MQTTGCEWRVSLGTASQIGTRAQPYSVHNVCCRKSRACLHRETGKGEHWWEPAGLLPKYLPAASGTYWLISPLCSGECAAVQPNVLPGWYSACFKATPRHSKVNVPFNTAPPQLKTHALVFTAHTAAQGMYSEAKGQCIFQLKWQTAAYQELAASKWEICWLILFLGCLRTAHAWISCHYSLITLCVFILVKHKCLTQWLHQMRQFLPPKALILPVYLPRLAWCSGWQQFTT